MSSVPIVQGVAVGDAKQGYNDVPSQEPYQQQTDTGYQPGQYAPTDAELRELREHPKKQYQDVIWAVLFYAHLIAIAVVLTLNITTSSAGDGRGGFGGGVGATVIFMVVVTGLVSVALSTFCLSFMLKHSHTLVKTALIFSVGTSLAVGIVGFMMGSMMMGILGLASFAIGICYAKIVWPRIPFAASNLNTALTAVQANLGLAVVAYAFLALAFGWSIFWFLGVADALEGSNLPIVFLLFVSYYWVHQVLQNTVHVTTTGVIGTWWFVPAEASTFCSTALWDSFHRATTYSFGSICFGSLLVAVVQALRSLENYTRNNDDMNALNCIIQCILSCIESIIEYMNKWAYVYVGLYGFSYLEAGRNVIQLFQQKGWTAIITDDLTDNVLFMISLAIGMATGLVGLIFGCLDPNMFQGLGFEHASGPAFGIGFLVGYLLSSILMSVVSSAVNTVIVCYAEAPAEFQMNHPQLATEMRAAWVQAWPGLSI